MCEREREGGRGREVEREGGEERLPEKKAGIAKTWSPETESSRGLLCGAYSLAGSGSVESYIELGERKWVFMPPQ